MWIGGGMGNEGVMSNVAFSEWQPIYAEHGVATIGEHSGITLCDVDDTNERVFADALDRHGPTP